MTEPTPHPLLDEVARRLGIDTPDVAMQARIGDALVDAEDDVVGYLGRAIRPQQRTAVGRWPSAWGWGLPQDEPVLRVLSATPETFTDPYSGAVTTTGTFTVVYEVGLDYLTDPELGPIRRYVRAAALNNPELLLHVSRSTSLRGQVQSVSVSTEGQSKNVSYAPLGYGGGGQAGSDSPGALPSLKSLDTWRLRGRRVVQAPDQPRDPRVYSDGGWREDRDGFRNTWP